MSSGSSWSRIQAACPTLVSKLKGLKQIEVSCFLGAEKYIFSFKSKLEAVFKIFLCGGQLEVIFLSQNFK